MSQLVSVIITTYKRELELLSQAIESVRKQTYSNIELIVVDDNGRGNNFQRMNEKYFENQKDIIYLINEENCGAQFSRNHGILSSTGEIIAFLDDDDIWAEKKIEIQMNYMQKYNVGMVFCEGFVFKDNDLNDVSKYQDYPVFNKEIKFEDMLFRDYVGTTTQALIRRECFAKVGLFDPLMPARQDYEMWIRISKDYSIIGTSEPLFYHRIHSGEQISKNMEKVLIGYNNIYKKYKEYYKKCSRANAKMQLKLCKFNYKNGHYLKAIKCCICASIINPKVVLRTIKNYEK